MTNQTIETLVWVCIYAGMVGVGLGLWFSERHLAAGITLLVLGGGLIAAGAVLIWLRSRRP